MRAGRRGSCHEEHECGRCLARAGLPAAPRSSAPAREGSSHPARRLHGALQGSHVAPGLNQPRLKETGPALGSVWGFIRERGHTGRWTCAYWESWDVALCISSQTPA